jgi:sulfatase modifying factor 1
MKRQSIPALGIVALLGVCTFTQVCGADMEFVSISDPGFRGEMSKYEVTNAQYSEFLNAALASGDITLSGNDIIGASGSNSGADYGGQLYYDGDGPGYTDFGATNGGASRISYSGGVFSVDSGFDNHPVTYVSGYGAQAFCDYYGYALPTIEQWRAVADYDGSYLYGCGTTIDPTMANYRPSEHPYGTTPVGTFGQYGYGLADLAGNVFEWTSSPEPQYPPHKAALGGSWYYGDELIRFPAYIAGGSWDTCHPLYGFRVVANVQDLPPAVVPVPGAVVLGSIGITFSGWLLRRST